MSSKLWSAPVCVSGFQQVSNESREYEDLMSIVTSGYLDASSAACFTYSRLRLINNELLEKEVKDGCCHLGSSAEVCSTQQAARVHAMGSQPVLCSCVWADGPRRSPVTMHKAFKQQLFPVQLVLMKRTASIHRTEGGRTA